MHMKFSRAFQLIPSGTGMNLLEENHTALAVMRMGSVLIVRAK
jgi:hypothetical protein